MSELRYVIDVCGLEEEIRCTICENPMHTDRGCDGGCKYNDKVFKRITDLLDKRIELLPITPEPHWIPVTERLPKEEDSIFARYYGTDRWRKSMFRKKSREVIVTSVFEDGELHTEVAHTTDGEWHVGVNVVPRTVIAWMPLPEPYKGVAE